MNLPPAAAGHGIDWNAVEGCLFDLDGVLWLGDSPLPGLDALFAWLDETGLPYLLVTNNSSRLPGAVAAKLARFGVIVPVERVLTSSMATAYYLGSVLPPGAVLYVIGEVGLRQPLEESGFRLVDDLGEPAAAVVAGVDSSLTYDKLRLAAIHLQRGAQFIGTNADANYPAPEGLLPGAGAIQAALIATTGRYPLVVGKPEPILFHMALARLGSPAEHTVMVGDRLDTDVLGARRAGLRAVLVTTGVDTEAEARAQVDEPDAIYGSLEELINVARGGSGRSRRSVDHEFQPPLASTRRRI